MKFTIEVNDFWLDEGADLEPALQKHIVREVVSTITKSIQDKVDMQITMQVEKALNARLAFVISERISELIEAGTIMKNGKAVPLVDHIEELFHTNHGWNNPEEKMKKIAKDFGEQLKLQYNAMFANHIVQGLKTQGLLKDEVVKLLLEGKKA
jgi:hypothetical protein